MLAPTISSLALQMQVAKLVTASQLTSYDPHFIAGSRPLQHRSSNDVKPAVSSTVDRAETPNFRQTLQNQLAAEPHERPITAKQSNGSRQNDAAAPKQKEPSPNAITGKQAEATSRSADKQTGSHTVAAASSHTASADSTRTSSTTSKQTRKDDEPTEAAGGPQVSNLLQLSAIGLQLPTATLQEDIAGPAASTDSEALSVSYNPGANITSSTVTTNAPTGALAIAMRIDTTSGGSPDLQQTAPPTVIAAVGAADSLNTGHGQASSNLSDDAEQEQKKEPETAAPLNAIPGAAPATPADSMRPDSPATAASHHSSNFETELSKFRAAEPVRGAQVQISGADSQRVDIRLLENGGTLSVTVRSGDTLLAKALQENVSDLNSHLNMERFHTEVWTPHSSGDTRARDASESVTQNQGGSNTPDRDPNQQQNGRHSSQPDWVDVLENNTSRLQKRIEYTWPQ